MHMKTEKEILEDQNSRANRANRESYIFLSLFLIILSFFIVLVSLSHIDKVRARLIFNQFSEVLQSNQGLRILKNELSKFTGSRITDIRTLQNIESEWSAELPLLDTDLDADQNILEVNIPFYEIISANSITIRKDREELLRRIANLMLVVGNENQQVYTDISYFGPYVKPASNSSVTMSKSIFGIGSIARFLENELIPTHALTIHHIIVDQLPILRINFRIDKILPKRLQIPLSYPFRRPTTG